MDVGSAFKKRMLHPASRRTESFEGLKKPEAGHPDEVGWHMPN